MLKSAEKVISKQVASRTGYYARNRVDLFFGTGSFTDEQTIEVVCANGVVETLMAKQIIVATGSRPYRPADIDFTHSRIYDSDTILSLGHTPRKLIVYGAGVIGCEYASIFSGLGVLVELVDNREQLLSFLDSEISQALSYHFSNNNITVRHNEEYERVEGVQVGESGHGLGVFIFGRVHARLPSHGRAAICVPATGARARATTGKSASAEI